MYYSIISHILNHYTIQHTALLPHRNQRKSRSLKLSPALSRILLQFGASRVHARPPYMRSAHWSRSLNNLDAGKLSYRQNCHCNEMRPIIAKLTRREN